MMTHHLTPEERRALVGRPPTAVQLDEGAYFSRPTILDAAYESFFDLATSISRAGVPILILQGLPGTGKSVLLLQLLERIQAEHRDDFDIELLESSGFTHESFARKSSFRRTVYIIDDLHQYDERGARDALEGAYRAGGSIIVSCGPSKDVAPFLASVGHLVETIKFDVPTVLSEEDREAATTHFSFPECPASLSSGTLMEWLFPQAKGNYAAFAGRFRAAIGNPDLARHILAFAAVDLELPLRLLPDAMRHRLLDLADDDTWLSFLGMPGRERVQFRYRQLAANILQSVGEREQIFASLMTCASPLTAEDAFSRELIDRVVVRHGELGFTSPKELTKTVLARFATSPAMRGLVFRRALRTIGADDAEFAAEVRAYLASSTSARDRARFAFWLWTVEPGDASVFESLKKALKEDVDGQAGKTARDILTWATQRTRPDDIEARAFDLLTVWAENATGKGIAKEWVLPALFKRLGTANPLADEDAALLRLLKPYLQDQPWTDMGEDVLVALLARTDAASAADMGLTWLEEHVHDPLGSAVFTAVAGRVRRLDSESPTRARLAEAASRCLIYWRSDRLSSLWQSVAEAALEVPDRLHSSFRVADVELPETRHGIALKDQKFEPALDEIVDGASQLVGARRAKQLFVALAENLHKIPLAEASVRQHLLAIQDQDFDQSLQVLASAFNVIATPTADERTIIDEGVTRYLGASGGEKRNLWHHLKRICGTARHSSVVFPIGMNLVKTARGQAQLWLVGSLLWQAAEEEASGATETERDWLIRTARARLYQEANGAHAVIGLLAAAMKGLIAPQVIRTEMTNLFRSKWAVEPGRALQKWLFKPFAAGDGVPSEAIDFILDHWNRGHRRDELGAATARAIDPILEAATLRPNHAETLAIILVSGLDHPRAPNARRALRDREANWPVSMAGTFEAGLATLPPTPRRGLDSTSLARLAQGLSEAHGFGLWYAGDTYRTSEFRDFLQPFFQDGSIDIISVYDPYICSFETGWSAKRYDKDRATYLARYLKDMAFPVPAKELRIYTKNNTPHNPKCTTRRCTSSCWLKTGMRDTEVAIRKVLAGDFEIKFIDLGNRAHPRFTTCLRNDGQYARILHDNGVDSFYRKTKDLYVDITYPTTRPRASPVKFAGSREAEAAGRPLQ